MKIILRYQTWVNFHIYMNKIYSKKQSPCQTKTQKSGWRLFSNQLFHDFLGITKNSVLSFDDTKVAKK